MGSPLDQSDSSYPIPRPPIIGRTAQHHRSPLSPHCQVRDGPTSSPELSHVFPSISIVAELSFSHEP
jgi:hypothetical protein